MQVTIKAMNPYTKNETDLIYSIDYCASQDDYVIHREVEVLGKRLDSIDCVGRVESIEEAMKKVLWHVEFTGFEMIN